MTEPSSGVQLDFANVAHKPPGVIEHSGSALVDVARVVHKRFWLSWHRLPQEVQMQTFHCKSCMLDDMLSSRDQGEAARANG